MVTIVDKTGTPWSELAKEATIGNAVSLDVSALYNPDGSFNTKTLDNLRILFSRDLMSAVQQLVGSKDSNYTFELLKVEDGRATVGYRATLPISNDRLWENAEPKFGGGQNA